VSSVKKVEDIKFGARVLAILESPTAFNEVVTKASIDRLSAQKVLAALHKSGYICKNERDLWVAQEK